ncbi:MAG: quinate 5-dehydrogenase [Bacillota bacterium]|nr:quinate 5-dehydrogenase [Bacillota bacterium]
MKRVVSVSLGSSVRDAVHEMRVLGEEIRLERRGTDGDVRRARELLTELDGQVDALGLGGVSLTLSAGRRKYPIREVVALASVVKRTPVVDGSGVKNSLEKALPEYLERRFGYRLAGLKALLVSGVDRWSLGEALEKAGCRLTIGDFVYALGLPWPLHSMRALERVAVVLLPLMCQLPLAWLYPLGKAQERAPREGFGRELIQEAQVVAGDFHYIRRHLPPNLAGKIVITNTVTAADREELARRGPVLLITTSPSFNGRSFATNVIEALIVAVAGRTGLTEEEYRAYAEALELTPDVRWLHPPARGEEAE